MGRPKKTQVQSALTESQETISNTEKPLEETVKVEIPIEKKEVPTVKYREVVYLGVADEAERIGAVTRTRYIFTKDKYRMPVPTQVNERDYPAIIAEKGRGCARRSPEILFMSKIEWDLELEQARVANR